MRSNAAAVNTQTTYEGAPARAPRGIAQLRRMVSTCMLFESTFYASGDTTAELIAKACAACSVEEIANVALEARNDMKLRHVPLFLLAQIDKRRVEARLPLLLSSTVTAIVQRPDEMGELLAIIQRENEGRDLKQVLSNQVKRGLAAAFVKFSPYQLAKWNRKTTIQLRDVMFLVHPKPKGAEQTATWKQLVDGTLPPPDTWEVALSAGKDKKATWERLLSGKLLGYMALLMNLRNMVDAGVERHVVSRALIDGAPRSRALPFRFLSAAKAAPSFAHDLSDAMLSAIDHTAQPIHGMTHILVDVSPSMTWANISARSTMTRAEATCALAILLREVCADVRIFTFSADLVEVPNHRGLGLESAIMNSQPGNGTYLRGALTKMATTAPSVDRVIVLTDEQSHDGLADCHSDIGYLVNVAPEAPGLDTSQGWTRINGFSERIVDWIRHAETRG